jgi:hypothetical protein
MPILRQLNPQQHILGFIMFSIKSNTPVAISMKFYGLQCAIVTPLEEFEIFRQGLSQLGSEHYMTRNLAKNIFNKISKSILKKDAYYTAHPERMDPKYQAWNDFCNDCVILTAIGSAKFGNPVNLIAPDTWEDTTTSSSLLKNNASTISSLLSTEEVLNTLEKLEGKARLVN